MPETDTVHDTVTERLVDGWIPSRRQERTWVRGSMEYRDGDDIYEEWDDGTEVAPMTEAEEADLLDRTHAPDDADSELDVELVADLPQEDTDG